MDDRVFGSLLGGARLNERWAWEGLYRDFAPGVLSYLRAHRARDPEELTSDVFLQVVRNLHTFEGGLDEFRGWLYRIAHNRLIDEFRARGRRQEEPVPEVPEQADQAAGEAAEQSLKEQELYALLSVLPEDQRSVVYMRYALDMQPAEIAGALERSVGSVKMLQQRALATLKARLQGREDLPLLSSLAVVVLSGWTRLTGI